MGFRPSSPLSKKHCHSPATKLFFRAFSTLQSQHSFSQPNALFFYTNTAKSSVTYKMHRLLISIYESLHPPSCIHHTHLSSAAFVATSYMLIFSLVILKCLCFLPNIPCGFMPLFFFFFQGFSLYEIPFFLSVPFLV